MDYAAASLDRNIIYAGGTAENILTDKRDIGRFVARIIKDERTLNQKVVAVGDLLTQNQICDIVERVSDEKIPKTHVSAEELVSQLEAANAEAVASGKTRFDTKGVILSYHYSKFVREDNCPANAKYLGYLDTRELYPDFNPISFEQFVREVLQGEAKKVYRSGR